MSKHSHLATRLLYHLHFSNTPEFQRELPLTMQVKASVLARLLRVSKGRLQVLVQSLKDLGLVTQYQQLLTGQYLFLLKAPISCSPVMPSDTAPEPIDSLIEQETKVGEDAYV